MCEPTNCVGKEGAGQGRVSRLLFKKARVMTEPGQAAQIPAMPQVTTGLALAMCMCTLRYLRYSLLSGSSLIAAIDQDCSKSAREEGRYITERLSRA